MDPHVVSYTQAVQDFRRARRRAALQEVLSRLRGERVDLLPYEEVSRMLGGLASARTELREIPLQAIVGSVGRYTDFNRSFLPLQDSDEGRWARVRMAYTESGLPPIEVYKIGEAYFVKDGNHRVSIARQLGETHIPAYVSEVHTRVALTPEDEPDEIIIKAEYAEFLRRTNLDALRPEADLRLSVPGRYRTLEEHIAVHRYYMGLEREREIPPEEAVTHWYDHVYMPVVRAIRERGVLRDFPDRTETDLYLWVSSHRAELEEALGWEVDPGEVAEDLADRFSLRPERALTRAGEKILEAVTPDELEAGPPPGVWRKEQAGRDRLFSDVLVAVGGDEPGWAAFEQALEVVQREGGRLRGLHVVSSEDQRGAEAPRAVQAEFARRCDAAGVTGSLVVEVGNVAQKICERSRWNDLVVVHLAHPPGRRPIDRLSSGFRTLIRRCATPVLAVPKAPSRLRGALLAYDGSPMAEEALFIATYMAGRWGVPLTVLTVEEKGRTRREAQGRARDYLKTHGLEAAYAVKAGDVSSHLLETAEAQGADLILIGGYRSRLSLEIVLGSTVDEVLRTSPYPTLISR